MKIKPTRNILQLPLRIVSTNKYPLLITLGFFLVFAYVAFFNHNYWSEVDGIYYFHAGEQILDGDGYLANDGNSTSTISDLSVTAWVNPDYSGGSAEFTVISKEGSFALTINNNIEPQKIGNQGQRDIVLVKSIHYQKQKFIFQLDRETYRFI